MSEVRTDPVTGGRVILASKRAARPIEFERIERSRTVGRCPFCRGNEEETPPPVAMYPRGSSIDGGDWLVRVVPNKYPALNQVAEPSCGAGDLYKIEAAVGNHEVIIEAPDHLTRFSEVNDQLAVLAFTAYRDRLRDLGQQPRIRFAQVFKNSGAASGASIQHVHSQLIALTAAPACLNRTLDNCRAFHESHGECLFCRILDEEIQQETRILEATKNFAAFCPFASRFPFEAWILPRRHASRFETTSDELLRELALLVRNYVQRLEAVLDRPAYNWLLHTAPFDTSRHDHYHWYIELFPRVAHIAGFELATEMFINTMPPEEAAAQLRTAAN